MRNLKKILALVLALVMSFSLMATANAFTDDAKITATYDEAVEVLNALKVFQGYEDGSFKPQGSITRAEVAAIIYRIVTGDVEDKQVSIYADYNKFNDVKSTSWYAGYVNFCANAEYIKGYDAKTFGPKDPVTGYQALAMILRAVGYDKNGEFTGSDWQVQTAAVGKKLGVTNNVSEGTLGTAASREVVAEILFQAIQKPQVTYTLAFGYNDSTLGVANESIGKETFGLYVGPRMNIDAWGRPGYNWYASKVTGTAPLCTIEEAYLAAYTTPMTECDVATDLGISVSKPFDTYTNGSANYVQNGETIFATATTSTIGGQGRLTEIYKDRIVYIDTMLASVANVTAARFDTAGHLAVAAQMTLDVWTQDGVNGTGVAQRVTLLNGATNWEYTAGQMLLVNAVTVNAQNHSAIKVGTNNVPATLEIVGVASSIQGAQTMLWWNVAQHTIDGQVYNDAFCFHRDVAQNDTIRYNWWLDQYGNIIGATELDRDSFAVIKDMIWVRGTPGYAQATLIDMAGNESTVTVRSIDGDANGAADFVAWDTDDAAPTLNDRDFAQFTANFAHVSTDSSKNAIYMGYALYRVTTNDDGSVNLEGWERPAQTLITHVNGATIDTTASAILVGPNVQIHVDDSTRFLVRTGNRATGFTYTAYTGTDSLPQFVPGSVELFYDGVRNVNGIASAVYVKTAQLQSDFGSHLFVLTNNYSRVAGTLEIYNMNVMVDGVARTIATDLRTVTKLAANVGKLFHVTWNTTIGTGYGMVATADLVNEATDAERACNYLSQAITLGNGVLVCDGVSYHINNAAVVSTIPGINTVADIDAFAVANYGIWVVSGVRPYNVATTVYVGEKLNTGVAASVSAVDNNGAIYAGVLNAAGTTFTITLPEDKTVNADLAALNVVATSDVNARLDVTGVLDTCATAVLANVRFLDSFQNADEYLADYMLAAKGFTFTVTNEAGDFTATYTVDIVEQDNVIDDMITEIIKDGDGTTQIATDLDGYKNIADAVANRTVLDVRQSSVIHLTEDGSKVVPFGNATYPVRVVAFTNSADATLDNFDLRLADVAATTTNDGNVSVASLIAGNVVVLRYVQQGTGAYFYIAFEVTNNAAN